MFFNLLKKYLFSVLVLFLFFAGICWSILHRTHSDSKKLSQDVLFQKKPTVHVTVFIHGTVGSTLNIFNPWRLATEEANTRHWSVRTVKKYRNQSIMQYDQILGQEGFYEFCTDEKIKNDGQESDAIMRRTTYQISTEPWHAATHVIPAYCACARYAEASADIEKYIIFGWSGLLHARARQDAGFILYDELCNYVEKLKSEYEVEPKITLVTHSHGGNVALWLAAAEEKFKRGLSIDFLCMYGAPMHKEMGQYIESPVFKTMVLFHSQGDGIQLRDYFSTKSKKSYQCMSDVANCKACVQQNPGCKRYDVCCVVNGNFKRVTHTNMWMVGRSTPVLDCMDPLPLFVLTPLLISSFEHGALPTFCEAHFVCNSDGFSIKFYDPHTSKLVYEPYKNNDSLTLLLQDWAKKMQKEWQLPDDRGRHPLFNRKNYKAFKNMLFSGNSNIA
jgi:hypothetical protein